VNLIEDLLSQNYKVLLVADNIHTEIPLSF
jgi:predicted deacetylase